MGGCQASRNSRTPEPRPIGILATGTHISPTSHRHSEILGLRLTHRLRTSWLWCSPHRLPSQCVEDPYASREMVP